MAYVNKLFNDNFLEYASYVIKDRAIPHLDDGLKPVQRRILHSLLEMDDGKFHKVANVVGHCMKYHPHGDASIYAALVNIGQKELLIDKQGNFGNIFTGDEASAARYIECRLLPLAKDVIWNPEITEYTESYDGRNLEPVVFPAKLPLILILGAEGIAVGMATKTLPHNFKEVVEALKATLRGEEFQLFPDFLTGGLMDASGYNDGQGGVVVRAKLDTSDEKRILIRELPYGTTTQDLITNIEAAAKKGKIKIAGISDFTTGQVEIEIKLPRGVYTKEVVDALYAFTNCQMTHQVNLLVIKDGIPTQMTVTQVILHHAKQLVTILKKELELEERKLLDRLHARTLERIFIEERIYKKIEEEKSKDGVVQAVRLGFVPFKKELIRPVSDEDIEKLLQIPIRRISLYDIQKNRMEVEEINTRLKEVRHHLAHLTEYALGYLDNLLKKNGAAYPRLTKVQNFKKIDVKDVVLRDKKLRYDKATGYLGYNVSSGDIKLEVSELDKILVMKKDGTYKVFKAPEKLFVGKSVIWIGSAEKDDLAKVTFTMLVRAKDTGYILIKRFQIEGYIMDKEYDLIPENTSFMKMTTRENMVIRLEYKQKSLMRMMEETFPIKRYLVKGSKSQGVRLTTKETLAAKFVTEGSLEEEGEDEE